MMDSKFYYILLICILLCDSKKIANKYKKSVNLAFSVNNKKKYIDFLLTALVSLLDNSSKNTIYNIYIQINHDFFEIAKSKITKLEEIFFNCFIHFIDMKNDFRNALKGKLDYSTYYRLKLPILCPKLNRIIHIDIDTIILKDLTELYTINFEGNYILGRLDSLVDELDKLGIMTKTYINNGILLIDLYSLRKYKYVDKFNDYIKLYRRKIKYLNHHDQTLLNYVCYDKIGILEPKFHMLPFVNEEDIVKYNSKYTE